MHPGAGRVAPWQARRLDGPARGAGTLPGWAGPPGRQGVAAAPFAGRAVVQFARGFRRLARRIGIFYKTSSLSESVPVITVTTMVNLKRKEKI